MTASITVYPTHSATQFILKAVRPQVSIDGEVTELQWKSKTPIEVAPGTHDVEVYYPYLGHKSGATQTTIAVNADEQLRFNYRSPIIVTSNGKLTRV